MAYFYNKYNICQSSQFFLCNLNSYTIRQQKSDLSKQNTKKKSKIPYFLTDFIENDTFNLKDPRIIEECLKNIPDNNENVMKIILQKIITFDDPMMKITLTKYMEKIDLGQALTINSESDSSDKLDNTIKRKSGAKISLC